MTEHETSELGKAIQEVSEKAALLVHEEIELAKAELAVKLKSLARGSAANTLVPGDHGSTFAGQPLACAAALATLDVLEDEHLMENAQRVGAYFRGRLHALEGSSNGAISAIRGRGLMVGVDLAQPIARKVNQSLFEQGVIANATGDHTLRFVPPLTVTEQDCDRVVEALGAALASVER